MTQLPPLPIVASSTYPSGAFLIDNSTIEKSACGRLYELASLRKRTPASAKAGRNFGAGLHIGWKTRYSLCGNNATDDAAKLAIDSAMQRWFDEHPQPLDDFRSFLHATRVMDAYNSHYGNEMFRILNRADGRPAIESSFTFPIGTCIYMDAGGIARPITVVYTGRTDLFIGNNDGEWVFDHKTAFMFGGGFERQMGMDGGQLGYCWAFKQFFGRYPRGYIIDAVRIRRPTRKAEYDDSPPVDSSDLQRLPYFVMPDTIEDWRLSVLGHVQSIFDQYARGFFPMQRRLCENKYGACDMHDVCNAAVSSRESVLSSQLYEDDNWSPLNPTT